jgi:hypothetical protein
VIFIRQKDVARLDIDKEVSDFENDLSSIVPITSILDDFSHDKYTFFDIDYPLTSKTIGIKQSSMHLPFHMNLRMQSQDKNDEKYVQIDFRTGHNYLMINHNNGYRSLHVEAQEQIYCDKGEGYRAVIKEFIRNSEKNFGHFQGFDDPMVKDIYDYNWAQDQEYFKILMNEDILLFDDHNKKHQSFRGWTGEYDPHERFPADLISMTLEEQKISLGSTDKMKSLEKRINTLKILFDEIKQNSRMQQVDKDDNYKSSGKTILCDILPEYSFQFENTLRSGNYSFMRKFNSELKNRLKLAKDMDSRIIIDETMHPAIFFQDNSTGAAFYSEYIDSGDDRFHCELHIPLNNAKDKNINSRYNRENDILIVHPDAILKKPLAMTFEYVKDEKDIPSALERCMKRIIR